MDAYRVVDVSSWDVIFVEPGGDDPKEWVQQSSSKDGPWLYKQATIKNIPTKGGGTRLYRKGEDWVEKTCGELAQLIGLPAARVELAVKDDRPGLISLDTKPAGWSLHGGGIYIAAVDGRYQPKTDGDRRDNRIGHNLDNIERVLSPVAQPPSASLPSGFTAFDVFAGYLLFDAWIANRDRHESNWALLEDPLGGLHLSASFDHGAALGVGLEDSARQREIDRHVKTWCNNATAHRFEDCHDITLLDLAAQALERSSRQAKDHWVEKVAEITPGQWQDVVTRIGTLSEVGATFTSEVLRVNQERICDEFCDS